ncbi:thiamine-phosphate synthase [Leptospira ryugenii]|uniref:Thiamine-phosphate synthase n=1 Tax=Leptospira ryugenii TaxID=1917863 RepID=A0A2P2E1Q9_9LEPT|nr:thiamine phosphate synthase [Leptospira ryugenii]GBF50827.1 thiamine-phosphate synthase [Leptospira ryugenii]
MLIRGLYLVTDRSLCLHHSLEEVILKSVQGGVQIVQLREKEASSREFFALATRIKELLSPFSIPLLINDRLDIALAVGAHGLHLGQSDLPVIEARRLLGDDKIIGLSVETEQDVLQAKQLPVDYLGVSPIFATPTKRDTKSAWGLDGLRWIRKEIELPLVAIGGINDTNAEDVISAGADSLALVSYLCSADDPTHNAEKISKLWKH